MSDKQDKQPQKEQPLLLIDGRPATEKERRRIFGAGTQAEPRKDDRETSPLHTDRGFNLMR